MNQPLSYQVKEMEVLKTEEFMTLNDDGKQKGTEKTKSPEEMGNAGFTLACDPLRSSRFASGMESWNFSRNLKCRYEMMRLHKCQCDLFRFDVMKSQLIIISVTI